MIEKEINNKQLEYKGKRIDWYASIGKYIDFKYGDLKDKLLIKNVYKRNRNYRIVIEYKDKEYDIGSSGFLNCDLGLFLKHINLSNELYERWNYLRKQKVCTEFFLSEDKKYWIGVTLENEKFLFDGDNEIVEYIKSYTWRREGSGYIENNKGEKLHRIVMGIKDPNIFINHLGRDKSDNRKSKLSISDSLDNSREKDKSKRNNSGVVGLLKRRNKWVGNIKIKDVSIYSKYKERNEALIDLLIMQRYYGFRHNENLYYLLEDISKDRIDDVINNCERQLNKKRNDKICSTNKMILSEDKTYYTVYDNNNNTFIISAESVEKVKKGIWRVTNDKGNISVHGCIINQEGKRIEVKLHRYLLNLLDNKYNKWYIVKENGNELDNRLENLTITDVKGAGLSKKCENGYQKRNDGYRVLITVLGVQYRKQCKTEQEARKFIQEKREQGLKERLQFKTKEELDTYLSDK